MKVLEFLVTDSDGSLARELCLRAGSADLEYLRKDPVKIAERVVEMDVLAFAVFCNLLEDSPAYRGAVFRNFRDTPSVELRLRPPTHSPIDYKTNEMVLKMCMERRELENTLSWLSTFGGAFSALGDSIERCALVAGKISLRQLGIAIRLGDPFTVIRCKLYCALSFIQLGRFKEAAEIVKTQYKLANSGPVVDEKVVAMCHGIWAKLRYDRRQSKLKKRHPD